MMTAILSEEPVKIKQPNADKVKVWVDGNELVIDTPYHRDYVSRIRCVEGRRWDGKYNRIKITPTKSGVMDALRIVRDVFRVTPDVEIPDVAIDDTPTTYATVTLHEDGIWFKHPYNGDLIARYKQMGGRWNSNEKIWSVVPRNSGDVASIKDIFEKYDMAVSNDVIPYLDDLTVKFAEDARRKQELIEMSNKASLAGASDVMCPSGLSLLPYQQVGVKWIEKVRNPLIADEMGLGKTVQALAFLYNHPESLPALVVCPKVAKLNWFRETMRWVGIAPDRIALLEGRNESGNDTKHNGDADVYIINYANIPHRLDELMGLGIKTLIVDEAHNIKNMKAKRTDAVLKLGQVTEFNIALTGTPILNRPKELFPLFKLLKVNDPDLSNYWRYCSRYCGAIQTAGRWDFSGASNLDELNVKLRSTIMLRRLKRDVIAELPEKRRIVIPIEIDNREEYVKAETRFRDWYLEQKGREVPDMEVLVQIGQLRQVVCRGKLNQTIEIISNLLEEKEQVVVFAHHVEVQQKIAEYFRDIVPTVAISGGMTDTKLRQVEEIFRNRDARLCVVSLEAGKEAINLQTASTMVFCELGWTPGLMNQAEDRIHRIGQHHPCEYYYIIGEQTIDEWMQKLLAAKQEIIDHAIDGISDSTANESVLGGVVNKILFGHEWSE